ncbi:hypothetical protein BLOT_000664 [Blomia tropicalis]|nr:hypothetical protein BLOT_000664 [Blomia tropicalis]
MRIPLPIVRHVLLWISFTHVDKTELPKIEIRFFIIIDYIDCNFHLRMDISNCNCGSKMNSSVRNMLSVRLYEDEQFSQLNTNHERIDYVLTNVWNFDKFRSMIETNVQWNKVRYGKCLSTSQNYREEGDKMMKHDFDTNQIKEAYVNAIIHAPMKYDEHLIQLYQKMSEIERKHDKYESALYLINRAIDISQLWSIDTSNYLEMLVDKVELLKLTQRFHSAQKLIHNLSSNDQQLFDTVLLNRLYELKQDIDQLIDKSMLATTEQNDINQDYRSTCSFKIDSRCKIETSSKVGRHFIATDTIPSGELILNERPYSTVLNKEFLRQKCSNCYRELSFKLHPCSYCTEVLFCDSNCAKKAYDSFHRYECRMLSMLFDISHSSSLHVFRMISRIGPIQAYDLERSLLKTYSVDKFLCDIDQNNSKELKHFCMYKMYTLLLDHDEKHELAENVQHTLNAIEIAVMLDLVHNYRHQRSDHKFLLDFIVMVMVDLRRIGYNVFGWQQFDSDWSLMGNIANSLCLIGSLINHSCVPNTQWGFSKNGIIQFVTNRTIEAGQEITISYGTYQTMDYEKRLRRLGQYHFQCNCNACFDNVRHDLSVRCTNCDGPIMAIEYSSPLIHFGLCTLCHNTMDKFNEPVNRLNQIIQSVSTIYHIFKLIPLECFAQQSIELMESICKLSFTSSRPVITTIFKCSKSIRNFIKEDHLELDHRTQISLSIVNILVDHFDILCNEFGLSQM